MNSQILTLACIVVIYHGVRRLAQFPSLMDSTKSYRVRFLSVASALEVIAAVLSVGGALSKNETFIVPCLFFSLALTIHYILDRRKGRKSWELSR